MTLACVLTLSRAPRGATVDDDDAIVGGDDQEADG
jgi:hypothetical protein